MDSFFADGNSALGFGSGAVRIDLYTLGRTADAAGNPVKVVTQRIVMTPQGFIEAFSSMQGMADKMVEMGMLQRRDRGPAAFSAPVSPNFGDKPL